MKSFIVKHKKPFFFAGTILLCLLLILFSRIMVKLPKKQTPSPTPMVTISPLPFSSIIMEKPSKEETIRRLGEPVKKESTTEDTEIYYYQSRNPNSDHEIVFDAKTQTVIFVKKIIATKDLERKGDIVNEFGLPPYVLYGPHSHSGFNLYIYPDKGIAYVGNPYSELLLEIWYFEPTTIKDFKTKWATSYSDELIMTER